MSAQVVGSEADPHQQAAIDQNGHALVSACPGAGKTRVLALRAARLLTAHDTGRLVAVTFTRDAARSLRARILDRADQARAGQAQARRVASGTFHALALNQLRGRGHKKKLRILSAREQRMLIAQARRIAEREFEFGFDTLGEAVAAIDTIKASTDPPPSAMTSAAGGVFLVYQRLLEQASACDFADLLIRATEAMTSGRLPPIKARWFLVDEAQDMDEVQYAWIKAHIAAGVEVMCVADDDQSIYQWRHALGYPGLMQFKQDTNAAHLLLPTNYRCRPEILAPAARLIGHNTHRVDKSITAGRDPGGTVQILECDERGDELGQLAATLSQNPGNWAVLARTNRILNAAERFLTAEAVPYRRVGGRSFWESGLAQAYLGLLSSVTDNDPVGLLHAARWSGLFRNDDVAVQPGETAESLLSRVSPDASQSTQASKGVSARTAHQLRHLHHDWRAAVARGRESIALFGISEWLGAGVDEPQAEALEGCAQALSRLSGSLKSRIQFLTDNRKDTGDDAQALLMTMHTAKGLEFPSVWVVACELGLTPHRDGDREEERRLFYVAMTRAEDRLVLSYARDEGRPSPFIHEAGLSAAPSGLLLFDSLKGSTDPAF